jgi:hypothetical protein
MTNVPERCSLRQQHCNKVIVKGVLGYCEISLGFASCGKTHIDVRQLTLQQIIGNEIHSAKEAPPLFLSLFPPSERPPPRIEYIYIY